MPSSGCAYSFLAGTSINLESGEVFVKLRDAVNDAQPNDRLSVLNSAFDIDGVFTHVDKPIHFVANVETVTVPESCTWMPSTNTITSSEVWGWQLNGMVIAPTDGLLVMNAYSECGGEFLCNGATIVSQFPFITDSFGVSWLNGHIVGAVEVFPNAENHVVADTIVYDYYMNFNDATTIVHRGTLHIVGDIINWGTLLGDVSTGPGIRGGGSDAPRPGDGMAVGGDYIIGSNASLTMLNFEWTLGVSGNFDCAIDDNNRFMMIGATLAMNAGETSQTAELMSADIGDTMDGLDPLLSGNYPIGTFEVRTGATVNLVDMHDNANDGVDTCETMYVENLIVRAGGTLSTGGCNVYAANIIIDGVVKGEVTPIGEVTCQGNIANDDGLVNIHDLLFLIGAWGTNNQDADMNGDVVVNIHDLLILIGDWGTCE